MLRKCITAVFVVVSLSAFQATGQLPIIIDQPKQQAAPFEGKAVFDVLAVQAEELRFQWQKDGQPISAETNSYMVLNNLRYTDAGQYSVRISNDAGDITSAPAALSVHVPQAGALDLSFDPASPVNGSVNSLLVQPDGRVVLGGQFWMVRNADRKCIARLLIDGSVDPSFNPGVGPNSGVFSMALQKDGKLLIGGIFTNVNGTTFNRIARLNSDGTLDSSFGQGQLGANDKVNAIAVQADGKILVGGSFTQINDSTRRYLARLNTDGTIDSSFWIGFNWLGGVVDTIAIDKNGKILIGGSFPSVNGTSPSRFARLNTDGSVDTSFGNSSAGAGGGVMSIALQQNGKILIGGGFTTVNGVARDRIARLNEDGTLDTSFGNALIGGASLVTAIAVQDGGNIVVGGSFTNVNGLVRNQVVRLNPDGTVDLSSDIGVVGADASVTCLALQKGGEIILGGWFKTVDGKSQNNVARLQSDGILDANFKSLSGVDNIVYSLAVQSDGKALIGGLFTSVSGTNRNFVARLDQGGNLDLSFGTSNLVNNTVRALHAQSDGKILIGGDFTSVDGLPRNRIARLNDDGTIDPSFGNGLSGVDAMVSSITTQSDGKILIAGTFTNVNGVSRKRVARLHSNGAIDTTFGTAQSGPDQYVRSVKVQSDGRILVVGDFTSVSGTPRNRVARLNVDGSLDSSFGNALTGANSIVTSVLELTDGKVLIAGYFTKFNGIDRIRIARLNADGSLDDTFGTGVSWLNTTVFGMALQNDGKIVVAGDFRRERFGGGRNRIARLLTDGTLDETFGNGLGGADKAVYAIAMHGNDRIFVAGEFSRINEAGRSRVACLYTAPLNSGFEDIVLSNNLVPEHNAVGMSVGSLATLGGESNYQPIFSLAPGTGDSGNSLFAISGNILKTAAFLDRTMSSVQSIRIRATGPNGFSEKTFSIEIVMAVEFTQTTLQHGSNLLLRFSGENGRSYTIETSTNLNQWEPWESFIMGDSTKEVVYPSVVSAERFFRIRTP